MNKHLLTPLWGSRRPWTFLEGTGRRCYSSSWYWAGCTWRWTAELSPCCWSWRNWKSWRGDWSCGRRTRNQIFCSSWMPHTFWIIYDQVLTTAWCWTSSSLQLRSSPSTLCGQTRHVTAGEPWANTQSQSPCSPARETGTRYWPTISNTTDLKPSAYKLLTTAKTNKTVHFSPGCCGNNFVKLFNLKTWINSKRRPDAVRSIPSC